MRKERTIQSRVSDRQYQLLQYLSKNQEMSISEFVRTMLPNIDKNQLINDIIQYEHNKTK